jgi:hypothetical protein
MEKLTKIFTYSVVIIISLFISSAFAQNQVRITLHQPPPNQLSAKDLWRMTLDNTTGSPLEVYLEGYGEEQNEGRIVDGRSLVFTLPPGRSNYNYENFKTGNVNWKNRDYEEFIVRTGTVPAGTYTTCVTAYSTEGVILGMEKCITQIISRGFEGEITLISPGDGEELNPDEPVVFAWTPLPGGGPYTLKIVEIIGDQSPDVAMKQNKPFFEKDGIRSTTFQYLMSERKLEDGKRYAWFVGKRNGMIDDISGRTNIGSIRINHSQPSDFLETSNFTIHQGVYELTKKGNRFSSIKYPPNYNPIPYLHGSCEFGEEEIHPDPNYSSVSGHSPNIFVGFGYNLWSGSEYHTFTQQDILNIFDAAVQFGLSNRPMCNNGVQQKSIRRILFVYDFSTNIGPTSYKIDCIVYYECCLNVIYKIEESDTVRYK